MSDTIAPTRAEPVVTSGPAPGTMVPPARDDTPVTVPASVAIPPGPSSPADVLARLEDKTSRIEEKLARSEAATQRVVDRFETASHRMSEVAQQTDVVAVRSELRAITRRLQGMPGFGAVLMSSVITALLAAVITVLILRYAPGLVPR